MLILQQSVNKLMTFKTIEGGFINYSKLERQIYCENESLFNINFILIIFSYIIILKQ